MYKIPTANVGYKYLSTDAMEKSSLVDKTANSVC